MPCSVFINSFIILMALTVEIHTTQEMSRIAALIAIFARIESFGCQMMSGRASGGRLSRMMTMKAIRKYHGSVFVLESGGGVW